MSGCFTRLAGVAVAVLLAAVSMTAQDKPAAPDRAAIVAAARDVIGAARYATFVTLDGHGHPQARMVDPAPPEEDFTIWVSTNPRTRKAAQIAYDKRVTLLYFDRARESYVTLIGTARMVKDAAAKTKHWREEWLPFYKGGPASEDYALVEVTPSRLEMSSTVLGMKNDPSTWRPVVLDLRK